MTTKEICPKHETPNRKLIFYSMVLKKDLFMCDECEAEIDHILWAGAVRELSASWQAASDRKQPS